MKLVVLVWLVVFCAGCEVPGIDDDSGDTDIRADNGGTVVYNRGPGAANHTTDNYQEANP